MTDRTAEHRLLVRAGVRRLADALEAAAEADAQLRLLGELAHADGAAGAFTSGLTWPDVFGIGAPQGSCRLAVWLAWCRRNGWL